MIVDQINTTKNKELLNLKGVGPKIASKLEKLNIFTQDDLLFHLPSRYEDRTSIKSLNSLKIGESSLIQGKILSSQIKIGNKRSLIVQISDNSSIINLRFFYFSQSQQNSFISNKTLRCFGEVRRGPKSLEMVHPEYQFVEENESLVENGYLTPVYPIVDGLSQKLIRSLASDLLKKLQTNKINIPNLIPTSLCTQFSLINIQHAIAELHQPIPKTNLQKIYEFKDPAHIRLIFEELLAHQLSIRKIKLSAKKKSSPRFKTPKDLLALFYQSLSFDLTNAQIKVVDEIKNDLSKNNPMLRLIQGDVGSGKTVVAMAAAIHAIANGWQVAFMAPTELLAEQHFENISIWANKLNIKCIWLSGKVKGKTRTQTLKDIETSNSQIVIGTHALFQEEVNYAKLGLIIIDEQHRFGVDQRLSLSNKGSSSITPHQLVMTATPIPRTLAMTAYADLDLSVIDELPKNRQPIETSIIPSIRREEVIQRVFKACQQGRQVYWVCPLIEESETLNCQAAELTAKNLSLTLPDLNIGLVHGRLKTKDKSSAMQDFSSGKINLLVATTVIEVGVDVPNASLIIIENAERLGLSQLHQLRGRVGRGTTKSHCVLLYEGKLSNIGKQRLGIMRDTNDGFLIAEKDLAIRGPGELLGTKQTGLLQLRIADLQRDQYLLSKISQASQIMIEKFPDHIDPLINRWLKGKTKYHNV